MLLFDIMYANNRRRGKMILWFFLVYNYKFSMTLGRKMFHVMLKTKVMIHFHIPLDYLH